MQSTVSTACVLLSHHHKGKKKKSKLSHYGLEAACVPPLRMKFWTLREGMVKRAVTGFELRLPVLRACAPAL